MVDVEEEEEMRMTSSPYRHNETGMLGLGRG